MAKEEVYEVEDILDYKIKRKKGHFLIKWKGYPVEESTWEPESNMNCPAIVARFKAKLSAQEVETDTEVSEAPRVRANVVLSSPSSTRSLSPDRNRHLSSPPRVLSPSKMSLKPKGIAQFFKPSAGMLPTTFSDDLGNASQCENAHDSNDETVFNESMQKFQKMLSRVPGPPLTIRNDYDQSPPPSHFIYINETLYGPEVEKPDASFLIGCSCYVIDEIGGCPTAKGGCCLHEECECISQNPDGKPAYDADGLLLAGTSVIYECNKKCCCSIFNQPCKNRVIQMGRQVSLTIVRLPDQRGWGVVANHDIPRGAFIDLYLGEIISTKEATRRFISNSQGSNCEIGAYLFDLDFNYDVGTECEFTLDAYRYGNVSHFFNHSCAPNLKVYPCFIEHLDPRLHSIAFFACRAISKGEQLTFDYMGLQGNSSRTTSSKRPRKSEDGHDFSRSSARNQKNEPIKCLCGSPNCRKFIYI